MVRSLFLQLMIIFVISMHHMSLRKGHGDHIFNPSTRLLLGASIKTKFLLIIALRSVVFLWFLVVFYVMFIATKRMFFMSSFNALMHGRYGIGWLILSKWHSLNWAQPWSISSLFFHRIYLLNFITCRWLCLCIFLVKFGSIGIKLALMGKMIDPCYIRQFRD